MLLTGTCRGEVRSYVGCVCLILCSALTLGRCPFEDQQLGGTQCEGAWSLFGWENVCGPASQVRTFAPTSDTMWVMVLSIGRRRYGHRVRGPQNEASRATTAERAGSRWQ